MENRVQIQISAALSKDVQSKLQAELKRIEKKLSLNLNSKSINNMNTALKTSSNSVSQLIAKYKLGQISFQKFQSDAQKYIQSFKFSQLQANEQLKIRNRLQNVITKNEKEVARVQQANNAIAKKQLQAELVLENQIIQAKKKQGSLIDTQIRKRELDSKRFSAQLKEQMMLQQKASQQSASMSQAPYSNVRFYDQLTQQSVQTSMAGRMASAQRQLETIANSKAFSSSKIRAINTELDRLSANMSKISNSGMAKQWNTQFAKAKQQLTGMGKAAEKTQYSISNMVKTGIFKMLAWSAAATAIYAPIRAFQQGLQTLKEIDTQLVDIAKVTNMTKNEMKDLAKTASQVGIEFGRTAQEYLQAVTEFSRAGYNQQAEGLAKVSLLLQNVGDVSAETANQMLLAVDASYQLGGSEEELTRVVDMLNKVSNQNPTNIQKMADGIKSTASVFKLAGLSIEEFVALIGTATSVTQLEGSEVAKGIRTIILNLRKVTDAEAETTEETISKSEEVLKRYGIRVRDTGDDFRDTMEVFAQISEKFRGELKDNEVAQSEILSRLAGVRRANIFSSFITNWDMVEKQVSEALNSTGSAMKENEIHMDSWEAKSKQLSASMTAFWQASLNTDLIKNFIDSMRAIVEWLTEIGGVIPIVAGVLTTLLIPAIGKTIIQVKALIDDFTLLNLVTGNIPVLVGLIVASLTGLVIWMAKSRKEVDAFNEALNVQTKSFQELNKARQDNIDSSKEYEGKELKNIELAKKLKDKLFDLNEMQIKTNTAKIQMRNIVKKLNEILPDLNIAINDETGALTKNREEVEKSITAYSNLIRVKAAEKKAVESQERIIEAELALEKLNRARQELDAKAKTTKSGTFGSGFGLPAIEKLRQEYAALNYQEEQYQKTIEEEQGILKKLLETQSWYEGIYGDGSLIDENKDGNRDRDRDKGDTPSTTTNSLLDLDRYYKLNKNLDRTRSLIDEISSAIAKTSEDDEKWVDLQAEKIRLLKVEQSQVHDLAMEYRRRRNAIAEQLLGSTLGFAFEGQSSDIYKRDNMALTGDYQGILNRLKDEANALSTYSSDDKKAEKKYKDALNKYQKFHDLVEEFTEIQNKNIGEAKQTWNNLEAQINGVNKEIEDIDTSKLEELNNKLKETAQLEIDIAKERIDAVKYAEEQIQDMIEKGIEMKKDALDEELEDYQDYIDERIRAKKDEYAADDYKEELKKRIKERQEIQNKINQLQFDTSLTAQAKLKDLEKEKAKATEDIQKLQLDRRRDLEIQNLEDALDFKEEEVETKKELIDEEWTFEKKRIEARNSLLNQTFDNIRSKFPELFGTLGAEMGNFVDEFTKYQAKFVIKTGDLATAFQNEVLPQLMTAVEYANQLSELNNSIRTNQGIIDSIENDKESSDSTSPTTTSRSDVEVAKIAIGNIQTEWNRLNDFAQNGVASQEQMDKMKELAMSAQSLRDKYNLEFEDLRGYKGSFSQGINAGMVTSTGGYLLHGSPSSPEFVLNSQQMYNLIKNLSNNAMGMISPQIPSLQGMGGVGGINLSIVVNGNADGRTVNAIKNAGSNILNDMKKLLNKNGVYRN